MPYADLEAGAMVPYLLGQTQQESWSFAVDASAYSKQDKLNAVAQQKGAKHAPAAFLQSHSQHKMYSLCCRLYIARS